MGLNVREFLASLFSGIMLHTQLVTPVPHGWFTDSTRRLETREDLKAQSPERIPMLCTESTLFKTELQAVPWNWHP